jgi:DNA-binding NarL/FixJ family response regulator
MTSVAIIDDHPLYRQGTAMAVEQAGDLTLVANAASVEDFDQLDATVDIVLLDLHLPGIQGADGSRTSAHAARRSSWYPLPEHPTMCSMPSPRAQPDT